MFIPESLLEAVRSDGQRLRVMENVIRKAELAVNSCTEKSLLREMLGRACVVTGSLRGRP